MGLGLDSHSPGLSLSNLTLSLGDIHLQGFFLIIVYKNREDLHWPFAPGLNFRTFHTAPPPPPSLRCAPLGRLGAAHLVPAAVCPSPRGLRAPSGRWGADCPRPCSAGCSRCSAQWRRTSAVSPVFRRSSIVPAAGSAFQPAPAVALGGVGRELSGVVRLGALGVPPFFRRRCCSSFSAPFARSGRFFARSGRFFARSGRFYHYGRFFRPCGDIASVGRV